MSFPFPTNPIEAGKGKLISFISLEAGAGSSTLSIMTALTLAGLQDRVALIDFNSESKIRSYLGYTEKESSISLLDIEKISNDEIIFSACESINEKLSFFPGVFNRVIDAGYINTNLVTKGLTLLKNNFKITVANTNNLSLYGWVVPMLSDLVFIVAKPDRVCIDKFYETMDFLARLDASERAVIILNQIGCPGGIEEKDAVNFFKPEVKIKYDKDIPRMCNQRKITPDKDIKEQILRVLNKEVLTCL